MLTTVSVLIIIELIHCQGKDVHAIDAYVIASWMPPLKADPNLSLPVSEHFLVISF